MAIEEAVINIRLVLENLKASKDLSAALTKVRADVLEAEKSFTKLKRGFMSGGNASRKAAKEAEELAKNIAQLGKEVLSFTGGNSGLTENMMEMTSAMVDANEIIEQMAKSRKLNTDASIAEAQAVDALGSSLKEEEKLIKDLQRAKRGLIELDKAKKDIDNDSTLTALEKEEQKTELAKGAEREGFFPTRFRTTNEIDDKGNLVKEELFDDDPVKNQDLIESKIEDINDELIRQKDEILAKAKRVNQETENRLQLERQLEKIFNKRASGSLKDADNLNDIDLKDFSNQAEALNDVLENAPVNKLQELVNGLDKTDPNLKKITQRIEELNKEREAAVKITDKQAAADAEIAKGMKNINKLDLNASQKAATRTALEQKAVEGIKQQIKAEEDLVRTGNKYYQNANQNDPLVLRAQTELNREIMEENLLRIKQAAQKKGQQRTDALNEKRIEDQETLNDLLAENIITLEQKLALEKSIDDQHEEETGIGATFKANLNEPAMRAARAVREVGQGMQDAGRQAIAFGAASMSVTVPLIKSFAEFNQEVVNVVSVLGSLSLSEQAKAVDELSEAFLTLGERTEFTAEQIAEAARSLALAGFSADEIKESIGAVTNLASAGNVDLEEAAGYFANITRAFDIDTSNAQRVADVLASVATSSNTTIGTLGESFKFIAPIASATGQSLEQVSTALGVLGNAGISASRAGTGLSRAFSELLEKEDDFTEILDRIGSSYDRIDPTKNTVTEIVTELERLKSAGLLDTAGFFEMFDQRSARAVLTLVNQGADSMERLGEKAENSAGQAKLISEQRLDTLSGDVLKAESAFNSLTITIGSIFGESARNITQTLTQIIKGIRGFIKENKGLVYSLGAVAFSIGVLASAGGLLALLFGGVVKVGAAITTLSVTMRALQVTLMTTGNIIGVTAARIIGGNVGIAASFTTASAAALGFMASIWPLLAITAALALSVAGLAVAMSKGNKQIEDSITDDFGDRVESVTKRVDNLATSIRDVANSIDLIRKLPDLNLAQLRELSDKESLFTFDFTKATKEIDRASREGMKNLSEMTNKQLADNSWEWSSFSTQRLTASLQDLSDGFGTIFKGIGNLDFGQTATGFGRQLTFLFNSKTEILDIKKNEEGLAQIYATRSDDYGLLRERMIDITDLTSKQQEQARAILAVELQRDKLAEMQVQRDKMIKAFSDGRLGFEKFKTDELEKQANLAAEIEVLEAKKRAASGLNDFDAVSRIEIEIEALQRRNEEAGKNVEMAKQMLKSTDKELAASSEFVAQSVKVGKAKAEVNRRSTSLARIQEQINQKVKEGIQPTQQQLDILDQQIDLRNQAIEAAKEEVKLETDLAEAMNQVRVNEKARLDLIKEGLDLRKQAAEKQKKTEEEIEDSAPVGVEIVDGKQVPRFRTDKETRELQTKRAKEAQVGSISPEKLIEEIENKTNTTMADNDEEFLAEIEKAMAGESEFGTLGTFGKVELAERMEKERLESMSSVDALKKQEEDVLELKKQIAEDRELADRIMTSSDGNIDVFRARQNQAKDDLLKNELELLKKEEDLAAARKFAAENGASADQKILDAKQNRLDQEAKLDELQKNKDDKEEAKELKKKAEQEKKEREKEAEARKKANDKRKKAIEDSKFEDKKRALKMAKLKKDKNLEEKLTKEVAELTRQRAADSKFGTDEDLKKLKADQSLNAEQKKVVEETIARKKEFLKNEKELFEEEQKQKKEEKKDEKIEDLNKKAQKAEEKRLTTQEKIRDAMLKQAKTLKDFVLITKFLNRQEAIRKMAASRAREKAVGTGSSLDKALKDPKKTNAQKQKLFSKAAERLRQAKEMGITDLELQNLIESLKRNKGIMNTISPPAGAVNKPVNQNQTPPVQGAGAIVNNVANPNVIFNLAGVKDPDQFMNFIGENAKQIAEALFTKGGQQKAKNQGKNTQMAQAPRNKGEFFS